MITSLPELHFRCREIYSDGKNRKSDIYELQQLYKQLKTMELNEW